jgi:MinD superfamily P-loop ATPase
VLSEHAVTGQSFLSETPYGPMSHARLGVAEENSGKLVTRVRRAAAELVRRHGSDKLFGDGSPGTGCPVIASISGTDVALIVTEPTVSGVHDMERVLQLCGHFDVPALICINKADLNPDQVRRIHEAAGQYGARVIGSVPFDPAVNDALMAGQTVVEHGDGPAARAIRGLWEKLEPELAREPGAG